MLNKIEKIISELNNLGVAYCISVGITGEDITHCWNNLQDKAEILEILETTEKALVDRAEQLGISESALFYED